MAAVLLGTKPIGLREQIVLLIIMWYGHTCVEWDNVRNGCLKFWACLTPHELNTPSILPVEPDRMVQLSTRLDAVQIVEHDFLQQTAIWHISWTLLLASNHSALGWLERRRSPSYTKPLARSSSSSPPQ
jgi:hypothetical protein